MSHENFKVLSVLSDIVRQSVGWKFTIDEYKYFWMAKARREKLKLYSDNI